MAYNSPFQAAKILSIQNDFLGLRKLDLSLTDILTGLTDKLDSLDGNHAVAIFLMSEEGLKLAAGNRVPKEWLKLLDSLYFDDRSGSAALFKKPVIVENILEAPLWAAYKDHQLLDGFLSFWSQPIISEKNELLGTFAMYSKEQRKPNSQELLIIESLATSVKIVLERRQFEQQLKFTLNETEKRANDFQLAMKRLNKAESIAQLGSWEWDVLENVMFWTDELYRIFGEKPQAFGATFDMFMEYVYPDDRTKVQQAIFNAQSKKQVCIVDHRIVTKNGTKKVVRKEATTKFSDSGELVSMHGIIQDITEEKHQEEALQKLNKQLQNLSFKDGLTGIANRRMFDKTLAREWNRGIREHQSLALLMIDIDYFKQYNDRYGHQAGDECLKVIAQHIDELTNRSTDLCARYGGEEFVVFLPDTDLTQATLLAEKCREKIYKLEILHEFSTICDVVTVSIGVSSVTPDKSALSSSLIKNADEALYFAKESGRNIVKTV